jgi:hypothetical protein
MKCNTSTKIIKKIFLLSNDFDIKKKGKSWLKKNIVGQPIQKGIYKDLGGYNNGSLKSISEVKS